MTSLKPCPFCGDVVGLILKDKMVDCRYHEYSICCEGCDTNGPIATEERTPEEAIQKWNRRAIFSGGGNRASDEFIATGECQKSPETKKTYVVGGVIPKSIAGWRFEEAPDELQKLSTNGGDEDWLAEIPPAYFKDCDYFGPLPVYGLYNTGHEDPEEVPHPFKEGWKVRIGSHA